MKIEAVNKGSPEVLVWNLIAVDRGLVRKRDIYKIWNFRLGVNLREGLVSLKFNPRSGKLGMLKDNNDDEDDDGLVSHLKL